MYGRVVLEGLASSGLDYYVWSLGRGGSCVVDDSVFNVFVDGGDFGSYARLFARILGSWFEHSDSVRFFRRGLWSVMPYVSLSYQVGYLSHEEYISLRRLWASIALCAPRPDLLVFFEGQHPSNVLGYNWTVDLRDHLESWLLFCEEMNIHVLRVSNYHADGVDKVEWFKKVDNAIMRRL